MKSPPPSPTALLAAVLTRYICHIHNHIRSETVDCPLLFALLDRLQLR